jgi:hypothetical protein
VLHGDGTTAGPWQVSVTDLTLYTGDAAKAATQLTLDKSSGMEGDVLNLTIKVITSDPVIGGEGFVLSSTLGGQNNLWYGAIGQ